MAWNPSPPPGHTSGVSHFDAAFDGLRFALVKLDNFSLHMIKPTWTCNVKGSGSGSRWGTQHQFFGYQDTLTPIVMRTGSEGSSSCVTQSPLGWNNNITPSFSHCTPYIRNANVDISACEPAGQSTYGFGFSSMVDCEQGWESGVASNNLWNGYSGSCGGVAYSQNTHKSCHCYECYRGGNTSSCTPSTYHPAGATPVHYSTNIGDNFYGIHENSWTIGGWGLNGAAPEGGGAYSDTKWMNLYGGGAQLWGSPATQSHQHNTSYYSVGMTMNDITLNSSFIYKPFPVNDNSPSGDVGNVIYPVESNANINIEQNKYGLDDNISYYAIILIPTHPSHKAAGALSSQFEFKLHMERTSDAHKKAYADLWPSALGPSSYSSEDHWYVMGSYAVDSSAFDSTGQAQYDWYLAESNTGMMHNAFAGNDSGDEYHQVFGGIMDGEFARLDDAWWMDDGGPNGNPWNVELLSEIQKHMIKEACYHRLDTNLLPDDRETTILVTKTPACAPAWNVVDEGLYWFNAGDPNEHIIIEDDNPYFNLHVTDKSSGKTIVFKDVATGIQDTKYGRDSYTLPQEQGLSSHYSGLSWRQGHNGMTIAAELIQDWESYIFSETPSFSWDDIKVHTLRTVGWDSYIADTGGAGVSHGSGYMDPTGTIRGAFYEFDGRTYLKPPNEMTVKPSRYIHHVYGDATDNAGCTGKVLSRHPVGALCGHTNAPGSNYHNIYGATTQGFNDEMVGLMYIGLKNAYGVGINGAPISNTNTAVCWPNGPQPLVTYGADTADNTLGLWSYGNGVNIYVSHATGNYVWPDHTHTSIANWNANHGILPFHTNASANTNNQWAICTGNGMIYNTTPLNTQCTCNCAVTALAKCSTGNGSVTVTIDNVPPSGVTIDDISFSGSITTIPSNPTGSQGTINSTTNYYFLAPAGTHTVSIDITDGASSYTITQTVTIGVNLDITYSIDSAVVHQAPTCSTDGIVRVQFDCANVSGGTQGGSGGLKWAIFKDNSGTWDYENDGHPFAATTVYNGVTGSGVPGSSCPNIVFAGSSCNDKEFDIDGLSDGTYRVVLFEAGSIPNGSTDYTTWYDRCFDHADVIVSTGTIALSATGTGAACAPVDREHDYSGYNGTTDGTGYMVTWPSLTPSNMGTIVVTMTGVSTTGNYTLTHTMPNTSTTTSQNAFPTGGTDTYTALEKYCAPGTHTFTITDAVGCTATTTYTVNEPTQMSWDTIPSATSPPCSGGSGSISGGVALAGGCGGNVQYAISLSTIGNSTWSGGAGSCCWDIDADLYSTWQNTSAFTLPAGSYRVWAKNTCGCLLRSDILTIGAGGSLSSTIAVTNPGCTGGVASIAVSASGGTGPYTYTWTTVTTGTAGVADPSFIAPATSSNSFTQQAPGGTYDYECLVQDSLGCQQILTASTIAGAPLNITAVVSSISCAGGSNGSIDVTVTGGTPGYTYQWSGSSSATSQDLSSLGVGTYTLLVTDSTGGTPCTATDTWTIASTGGAEGWVDINQYAWSGYNTAYGDSITGTAADNNTYGKYGGPTCPNSKDGTIRLMLDSTTPVVGASFPFEVWLSNDGGANYYRAATSAGGSNWLSITTTDLVNPSTGVQTGTGVVYDPQTAVDGVDYFEITGNVDKWNPGTGDEVLPFTEGSTWRIKLIEDGASGCFAEFDTTILPSDYRTVLNQAVATNPTCCGCSSYGASIATNVCNGSIDNTPIRGTYEDHINTNYTYLWTYAGDNQTICSHPGHNNTNTQWSNKTTQDLTAEWPGTYTILTTDSCGGTDSDDIYLWNPVVYIDDITWVPPQCIDCCTGTLTITAHGGDGNLFASLDNGSTWVSIAGSSYPSVYTFTNMCGGISNIWVKDGSGCAVEYFADPDDGILLSSYSDNCFANANQSGIISTSGTWTPTHNSSTLGTATASAFTESSPTKIELIPVSNFTDATACIASHNIIPGDTNGEINLFITGGTGPYEVAIVAQAGPFYTPSVPFHPCWGIGPLTSTTPCDFTGDPISTYGPSLNSSSVMTVSHGGAPAVPVAGAIITTSSTHLKFTNVSVSRDLGYGGLGAEYIFYVRDSHGCYKTSHVGMDNGIFGIISVYGAMNCDCVCPIGYVYDEALEECVAKQATVANPNALTGYWTLTTNLYAGANTPNVWQNNGCALYGVWTGTAVDYAQSITINTNDLPLKKDVISAGTTGPNHLYKSVSLLTQIGVDLGVWNTAGSTSYINDRVKDIAIWVDQAIGTIPPVPIGEYIGCITEINFASNTPAVIGMASDAKMIMKIDGVPWIDMEGDESQALTVTSNYNYFNFFPIVLPAGLHTISFEVLNTATDAMMAFEVYTNQLSTGTYFVGDILGSSFSASDLQNYILQDYNGDDLSSKTFATREIQLGTTYGYSCADPGDAVSFSDGSLFCIQDVTAPCEVPLDCGYCLSDTGVPKPQFTKKGPCLAETDGHPTTPTSLNNVWVTDYSELSDLVECPGALANTAYARIMGALATRTLDVRQIWMTIIIRHLLHNLNSCMTLSDIQDVFTGFLDEVCPTCEVDEKLTPAQMEALTTIFSLNTNSNFDF